MPCNSIISGGGGGNGRGWAAASVGPTPPLSMASPPGSSHEQYHQNWESPRMHPVHPNLAGVASVSIPWVHVHRVLVDSFTVPIHSVWILPWTLHSESRTNHRIQNFGSFLPPIIEKTFLPWFNTVGIILKSYLMRVLHHLHLHCIIILGHEHFFAGEKILTIFFYSR